ncbi:MAG: VCBS repeat-containing protein [Planctomycetes bacterium]|nr:VCBS repeat-containing protein [Planctomycetota bacterium]
MSTRPLPRLFLTTILLTTATGTAAAQFGPTIPPPIVDISLNTVSFISKGDFNGDGKLGLVFVVSGVAGELVVYLGNGDGSFSSEPSLAVGNEPLSVAVGDLNNDGKLDLVAANKLDNNISALLGNGDGTFAAAVNKATGNGPVAVFLGDLNANGNLDAITVNKTANSISILLGNGNGTFANKSDKAVGASPAYGGVIDLNADGKLDIVTASSTASTISVLIGNGVGGVAAKVDYPVGAASTTFMALGDVNGDGKPDVNVDAASLSVLLGNGDGTFPAPMLSAGVPGNQIFLGDLNNDSKLDLVSPAGTVRLGNGDGTFGTDVGYSPNGAYMAIGDFNGDSKLDVEEIPEVSTC